MGFALLSHPTPPARKLCRMGSASQDTSCNARAAGDLTPRLLNGRIAMENRFGVVSADGHCRLMHLPCDLSTKRLPRRFQDDGLRAVQGPGGARQGGVEERPLSGGGR